MGHWGTCPLDFQLFNSSGHLWTLCGAGCPPRKNILAYVFVTVYCMNFVTFWCVTLKLFSLSFLSFLAPNPAGHTTAYYPVCMPLNGCFTFSTSPIQCNCLTLENCRIQECVEQRKKFIHYIKIHVPWETLSV